MRGVLALVSLIALLLTACGDDSDPAAADRPSRSATTSEPTPRSESTPAPSASADLPDDPARGRLIKTAGSEYGPMLFDRSGQAIYLFDKEPTAEPECYGACADAWPPVLTQGPPQAGGDVRSGLLGTTRRTDGTQQVTYAGHPLYFYAHEGRSQVLCHNVAEFGGLWLVLTPAGRPAPA